MLAKKLKKGDTIGIVCPSSEIDEEDIKIAKESEKLLNRQGYNVKYAKNVLKNTTGYGATAKEKAEDINNMYADKNISAIISLCGGFNSNTVFEYLDLDTIKNNNKIICGYSDATSYINYIVAKTGNIGFIGPNFKTICPIQDETAYQKDTDYCYTELMNHFCNASKNLSKSDDKFTIIKEGKATGKLIGGNLSMITGLADELDFKDKILFLEEFSLETPPELVSNYLYKLKQLKVFNQVKGLWLGNYDGKFAIEKILLDTLEDCKINFPIIKSSNFGHTERIMTIPLNVTAQIENGKITITESYLE